MAKYIAAFVDNHPDYLEAHRYTWIPEEIFFQSLVMNSDDDNLIMSVVNKSLTYVNWVSGAYPDMLRTANFDELLKKEHLFARKFDINVDSKILDMIDNQILRQD